MLGSLTIAIRSASVLAFSSFSRRPALQGLHHHRHGATYIQQSVFYDSQRHSTGIFMSTDDDDESSNTVESTWNLIGLKKEVSRLTVRCHKKIGKANQRLEKANAEVERLTGDPNITLEELEKCPNVEIIQEDLNALRERLTGLNQLEVSIADMKGKNAVLPEHVAQLAIDLDVKDEAPARQARPPKKEKGPKSMKSFRLPYRRYYTVKKTEIRVGGIQESHRLLGVSIQGEILVPSTPDSSACSRNTVLSHA